MKQPSVRKNFVLKMLYELLLIATPLITAPYVSRILGANGVGIYSYTASIMSYFTLLTALGTNSYGAREIARNRGDKKKSSLLFWEINTVKLITSIVNISIYLFFTFRYSEYTAFFLMLTPALLATSFDISWFYTGYEQIKYSVSINSICKLVGLVSLFVFVKDKDDLDIYILLNSTISLLSSVSAWIYLPKFLCRVEIKDITIAKHFKETIVYFIPTIASTVYSVIDKTLIGAITSDNVQNGYYEQAIKIIVLLKALTINSLGGVMESRMSYLFKMEEYDEIRRRFYRSISFSFLMAFACTFGIIAVANRFVPVFFGGGYEPVVILLRTMAPILLIQSISHVLASHYLVPCGYRLQSSMALVVSTAINLILNILLIPKFGALGATIGSVISEMFVSAFYLALSRRLITIYELVHHTWKSGVAGVVMFAVVFEMGRILRFQNYIVLTVQVLVGVIVYIIVLVALKYEFLYEIIHNLISRFGKEFRGKII